MFTHLKTVEEFQLIKHYLKGENRNLNLSLRTNLLFVNAEC